MDFNLADMRAQHWASLAPVETREVNWRELADWYDDDAKCEHNHTTTVCGVLVVARLVSCHDPLNICAVSVIIHDEKIRDPNHVCADCRRRTGECWRVVPI